MVVLHIHLRFSLFLGFTSQNGSLLDSRSILDEMGEEKIQDLINFSLSYMSQLRLPAKRGTFVEFRTGLINLCPVGRSCTQVRNEVERC